MNEQQRRRSDALKRCVEGLNSLCHIAKVQLDKEAGDAIRVAAWSDARIHALNALKSLYNYGSICAASGDDLRVVIDVAQFATLFRTTSAGDVARQ